MFAVLLAEAIPEHVRGYVSRYLQQTVTGLYVGVLTPRVADRLWARIVDNCGDGRALLVSANPSCETGYSLRTHNTDGTVQVCDFDGIEMPVEP